MEAELFSLADGPLPKDDGYRGIWYYNQPSNDEYRYKYSGGFATYPQQHVPIAYYAKEVGKTFFCYGGTVKGRNELLHMVSSYDHATGMVPRPTILLNKKTGDAHDNPTMMLDDAGYAWIFSNSHGTSRPSYIHWSRKPYSIDEFEHVLTTNFSYCHPWHIAGRGFLALHTRYTKDHHRRLFSMTSADGVHWDEPRMLAHVHKGHYQISWRLGSRLGTAFNYHPHPVGLNARTNLYYMETHDFGETWRNAQGQALEIPLTAPHNPALVREYEADSLLVYLKDIAFDAEGRPVILYLTSRGYESGPANDPRTWMTARWDSEAWEFRPVTTSDSNYDFGSLYLEPDGTWRIIAPTEPGPQRYNPGGEVVIWTSADRGATWTRTKQLTHGSRHNHTYVRRPVDAHPDFYALWADGHAREPSESSLYFTNRTGDHVWRLPPLMRGKFARPEIVW